MTGIEKAVEAAGGVSALAVRMDVSPEAVAKFKRQGWLPAERAKQVHEWYDIPVRDLVKPEVRDLIDLA